MLLNTVTHVVDQRPASLHFALFAQLFCTTYDCGATGRQTWPIFGFRPIFQYTTYMYTYWRCPTLQRRVVLECFIQSPVETTLSEVGLHALHRVAFWLSVRRSQSCLNIGHSEVSATCQCQSIASSVNPLSASFPKPFSPAACTSNSLMSTAHLITSANEAEFMWSFYLSFCKRDNWRTRKRTSTKLGTRRQGVTR